MEESITVLKKPNVLSSIMSMRRIILSFPGGPTFFFSHTTCINHTNTIETPEPGIEDLGWSIERSNVIFKF
jgi:hypothetical protein